MPVDKQLYDIELSTLETIDYAFYDFVNDKMNNFATKNDGWNKVPIVWTSAERSFLSKDNKELHDKDGTLKLPLITIERTAITKDLAKKGAFYGNPVYNHDAIRGGRIVVSRKVVRGKTNNFAAADNIKKFDDSNRTPGRSPYYPSNNKKVVYETITVPAPVYLSINYDLTVRAQYVQQMNQLISPFATLGGHINSFLIRRDGHRYETFMQASFTSNNNVSNMGVDERTYETKFTFDVLGYIMGESPNGDRPKAIKTENAVEVKIPREHVIFGDIPQYGKDKGFYTE